MGLYLSMYLGPYVECVVRAQTREVAVWGCTNVGCALNAKHSAFEPSGTKFCADCGSPWGKSMKAKPYRPNPHTVLGESEELTMLGEDPDAYYLGSNIASPRRFHCDASEGVHFDVSYVNQEGEMKWFCERHADDLATLAEAYDTRVGWGLHARYS
jgi:hypothetical protein